MAGEVLPPNNSSSIINNGNGRRAAGSYQSFGEQTNRSGGYEPIERDRRRGGGGTGRPWIELVTPLHGFGKPASLADTFPRLRCNLSYFRQNYAVSALIVIGLSLLWQPISLLVLAFLIAAWIYFYFSRFEGLDIHDHIVILGRPIGENVVLALLSVITVVVLALTPSSGIPLLVSLLIAFALIVLHASFRRTDILVFDAEDQSNSLLGSGGGPTPQV